MAARNGRCARALRCSQGLWSLGHAGAQVVRRGLKAIDALSFLVSHVGSHAAVLAAKQSFSCGGTALATGSDGCSESLPGYGARDRGCRGQRHPVTRLLANRRGLRGGGGEAQLSAQGLDSDAKRGRQGGAAALGDRAGGERGEVGRRSLCRRPQPEALSKIAVGFERTANR